MPTRPQMCPERLLQELQQRIERCKGCRSGPQEDILRRSRPGSATTRNGPTAACPGRLKWASRRLQADRARTTCGTGGSRWQGGDQALPRLLAGECLQVCDQSPVRPPRPRPSTTITAGLVLVRAILPSAGVANRKVRKAPLASSCNTSTLKVPEADLVAR